LNLRVRSSALNPLFLAFSTSIMANDIAFFEFFLISSLTHNLDASSFCGGNTTTSSSIFAISFNNFEHSNCQSGVMVPTIMVASFGCSLVTGFCPFLAFG